MNDIVLSSLINLFALFSSGKDAGKAHNLVTKYFKDVFGIREYKDYEALYDDLRSFYECSPEIDRSKIVSDVSAKLSSTLSRAETGSFALRLMEFCNALEYGEAPELITVLADGFGISSNSLRKYSDFLQGRPGEAVRVIEPAPGCTIKTLYLRGHNVLLFSYDGPYEVTINDVPVSCGVFQQWQQSAVMKCREFGKPLYFSNIASLYDGGTGAKPVRMSARDVEFRFEPGSDRGIHNLSLDLSGGELVAVMGGSGVGKSTLLSLLNGSLLPQSGSITVNGLGLADPEVKSLIGFVPQDDLLVEELTVFENLWYTAKLCFASSDDASIEARVMEMLRQLDLLATKDLKVGSPINKYISGGQRKRLNIALELIREPAILFLDEPTSGLSSSDTEKVVNLLKEQATKGRLVVANIHQPSSDVYKLFDRLILMDKGGYPIYDGNPIEAVSYFKTAANHADRTSACPTCGTVNPEQMLSIIDEPALDTSGHVSDARKVSPVEWHMKYLERRPEMEKPERLPVPATSQKRPSAFSQMLIFLRRNLRSKAGNLQYILVTALEAPVLAFICALLTRYTSESGVYTVMDNKYMASYFFMAIIVSVFMGMSGSAEEIIRDRALLKREKFLSLSYKSYIWSKVIYTAAICLVQTLLFILVGNSIMGVHGTFLLWWPVLFVSAFLSALIGLLLSQCLSSVVTIYITIPLLLIPQILLCGLVVDFEDMNPKCETGSVPVLCDLIPSRWAFEALSVGSFRCNPYESDLFEYDRQRYQALYYEQVFCEELETRAVTGDMDVVRTELPRMAEACGLPAYQGGYEDIDSLISYIKGARKRLSDRGNTITLALDRKLTALVDKYGMDAFRSLKQDNYNLYLESLVVGTGSGRMCRVVGNHILPNCGHVFLTPMSKWGRAPFYSGVKLLGSHEIPTHLYDMCVLVLMCLVLMLLLLYDVPGKFVRKERN